MGIDLSVAPNFICKEYKKDGNSWHLGFCRMDFHRCYELFDKIRELEIKSLPSFVTFDWYEDDGCKNRTKDPYGDKLTFVEAEEFKKIKMTRKSIGEWNFAILKMLQNLPAKTPVVLWWH